MIGLVPGATLTARYVQEIVAHAGFAWRLLTPEELPESQCTVLVIAGDAQFSASVRDWLTTYVSRGGVIVVSGGTAGLNDLLGATVDSRWITEGYLELAGDHPLTTGFSRPLHIFGAVLLRATTGQPFGQVLDQEQQATGSAALVIHQVGHGLAITIAADLPGSILHVQLGRSIDTDGEPAPDGTAPIDDDILKTDDGVVLSWQYDRRQTPSDTAFPDCPGKHPDFPAGDTPWFAVPVADELRTVLLRALGWGATQSGQSLPAIWYWPRGLSAVGLISHDSDHNIDESARETLRLLTAAEIRSTWCNAWSPIWTGQYSAATHALVLAAGHEIALHYNARPEDGGTWSLEALCTQLAWLKQDTGVAQVVSNKNHYLRWEGSVEFFHWLAQVGLACDQSKGPSKKGNIGYPHGSCQPWYPLDPATGQFIDVLEIPLQTQDLWLTTPATISTTILAQAQRHHGIAHFLFHQVHLQRLPEVAAAMLAVVAAGREAGLEWWTSAEINRWERQRRTITATCQATTANSLTITVTTPQVQPDATFAVLVPQQLWQRRPQVLVAGGGIAHVRPMDFHGLPALLCQLDIPAGTTRVTIVFEQ